MEQIKTPASRLHDMREFQLTKMQNNETYTPQPDVELRYIGLQGDFAKPPRRTNKYN